MKTVLLSIATMFFLIGCNNASSKVELSSEDIGIRKAPLSSENKVQLADFNYSEQPAGSSQKFQRSYENAPPLIPHSIDGLLPITTDNNQCLGCHLPDVAQEVGATPIPPTHFIDFRTGKKLDHLSDERFNCVQCHVPQANLDLAVKNKFKPQFRYKDSNSKSNLLNILNQGIKK